MSREFKVSDSVVIDADAQAIWAQIADPTQMSRWSGENTGAATPEAGRPLRVGERFDGTNKRGPASWVTQCVVVESEPGRRFCFTVDKVGLGKPVLGLSIATWTYDFEPVDGGTRVTETWRDERTKWPTLLVAAADRTLTGGTTYPQFQRANIRRTLARMKADFESNPR